MEERAASRTAVMVAGYRARATEAERPVCRDPWARALAGEEGERLSRELDRVQRDMEMWIAVRTRAIDDRLLHAIGPRCQLRQVVVLGAGLDTRAARLAREGVRFFEVDQPASQADKRERLARVDGYPIDAATYVACDFEHHDFLDALLEAGFDTTAPAFVVWEGVTPYLTERAVRATFHRIAHGCHPRTVLVFDHVGKKIATGQVKHTDDVETRTLVDGLGEPILWGSNHVLPVLFGEGFRRVHQRTFDELALDYTGTYDRDRKWRFQFLAEASVESPEIADDPGAA